MNDYLPSGGNIERGRSGKKVSALTRQVGASIVFYFGGRGRGRGSGGGRG